MLTEQMLAELLAWVMAVIETEKSVEACRQVLFSQPHTHPFSVFRELDTLNNGYLCVGDFVRFCTGKIQVEYREIGQIFAVWDLNTQGRLSYSDFVEWIFPMFGDRNTGADQQRELETGSRHALVRLLEKELLGYRQVEFHKKKLLGILDFSNLEAFAVLDSLREGILKPEGIFQFLIEKKVDISMKEVEGFFKRLDRDRDGMITYTDFVQSIMPQRNRNRRSASFSTPKKPPEPVAKNTPRKSKKQFAILLKQQLQLEKGLEFTREKLAMRADFSLGAAFNFFTKTQKLKQLQFVKKLKNLKLHPFKSDIDLLFKTYDKDQDGAFSFQEFCDMIVPNTCCYQQFLLSKAHFSGLSLQTRKLMSNLFTGILTNQRCSQQIKKRAVQNIDLNSLFYKADTRKKGYWTDNQFRNILRSSGKSPTKKELNQLIKRYSTHSNRKVTYPEFVKEVLPTSLMYK